METSRQKSPSRFFQEAGWLLVPLDLAGRNAACHRRRAPKAAGKVQCLKPAQNTAAITTPSTPICHEMGLGGEAELRNLGLSAR